MKKKVALLLVSLCFASMIFMGCSSNNSSDAEVETEVVVTETTTEEKAEEETTEEVTEATTEETTEAEETSDDGIDPDFKEAMDSYEAFFDEYCEFMTKYAESDGTDLSLLADYATYMTKYTETINKLDAIDEDELNDAELAYYIDVNARIQKKLLEVAD